MPETALLHLSMSLSHSRVPGWIDIALTPFEPFLAWYAAFLALALSSGAHLAARATPNKAPCFAQTHFFQAEMLHNK